MMHEHPTDDRRMFQRRETDQPPSSVTKQIGIALAVTSLAASLFTAGYNWRSISIVEGNQENFVRKDVQSEQFRNVNDRLSEIVRQLEELRASRRKDDPK